MNDDCIRATDNIVSALAKMGVTHIFGVGGANIEDLYDSIANSKIHGVVAKHEYGASAMADGYARVTGKIGVVATTSGAGAMNVVPGIAEAYSSRTPVLALIGQPPSEQHGKGAFQDSSGKNGSFNAHKLFTEISKYCATVDNAAAIDASLNAAYHSATTPPMGPSVLLIPKDVQQSHVSAAKSNPKKTAEAGPKVLDIENIDIAAGVINSARKVLIIAGEGAAHSKQLLQELSNALDAWTAVTPDAKDVFDNKSHAFVGVAGLPGHESVAVHLKKSSVCLLVGTRFPLMVRGSLADSLQSTDIISIGTEAPFADCLATITSPVPEGIRLLLERVHQHKARPLTTTKSNPPRMTPKRGSYARIMDAIAKSILPDADIFVDAGNVGAAAINRLPPSKNGRFVAAVGMGGMGYTFGASIGASFGTGRRAYAIAGDGAFFMHGMELHTAIEYNTPTTFIIINNNAHAMCLTREQIYYGADYTFNRFKESRIGAGMQAMFPELPAYTARTPSGLTRAIVKTNHLSGPAFIEIVADADEIPPFHPFLKTLAKA